MCSQPAKQYATSSGSRELEWSEVIIDLVVESRHSIRSIGSTVRNLSFEFLFL